MNRFRRIIVAAAGLAVATTLLTATPARAGGTVSCGQEITTSTTLQHDLFCPTGHGVILRGDNIVFDLNGHTIAGKLASKTVTQEGATGDDGQVGTPYTVRYANGQFAGVRVAGSGNTVTGPGTIKHFAAGVLVAGGNENTIQGLVVEDNRGPAGSLFLGDGIIVLNGDGNRVANNLVRRNGPFSGIALYGGTDRNVIEGNVVRDNNVPEICPNRDVYTFSISGGGVVLLCGPSHSTRKPYTYVNQQNMGIKIENQGPNGTAAHFNTITGNLITGSGNAGIIVTTNCPQFGHPDFDPNVDCRREHPSENVITGNVANRNGFGFPQGLPDRRVFQTPAAGGDGIILLLGGPLPPVRHTVTDNVANGNSANGIGTRFGAPGDPTTNSLFAGNTALDNNAAPVEGGAPAFNGVDAAAFVGEECDSNVWRNNNFGNGPEDIGGPVPPNDLTNHPCVGPVLAPPPPPTSSAAEAAASDDVRVWRAGP